MNEEIRRKVYIDVISKTDKNGNVTPMYFIWEDGEKYEIDEVKDVRRAASTKAGGVGLRYTIRIEHHETYLFYEDIAPAKWFVEGKVAKLQPSLLFSKKHVIIILIISKNTTYAVKYKEDTYEKGKNHGNDISPCDTAAVYASYRHTGGIGGRTGGERGR